MIIVKRKLGEFPVYTKDEADQEGRPYVPWREASEVGQWVLTDDEHVVQVLSLTDSVLKTTISYCKRAGKEPLNALSRIQNKAFSSFVDRSWVDILLSRHKIKRFLRALAIAQLRNLPMDWAAWGEYISPGSRIPEATAKRILKIRQAQVMVTNEMEKILRDNGLDDKFATEVLKDAIAIAREKKNPFALLQAFTQLDAILHPKEKPHPFPNLPPAGMVQLPEGTEILREIDKAEAEVVASRAIKEEPRLNPILPGEDQDRYVNPEEILKARIAPVDESH